MRRNKVILIFLALAAFLTVFFGAAAQDADIDSMTNEQLMLLMQSIINKLEEKPEETPSPTPTAVPTPTATPEPVPDAGGSDEKAELMALMQAIMEKLAAAETETEPEPVPDAVPAPIEEVSGFKIYENKKLLREKIPDYYFVQPEEKKEKKEKDKKDGHKCPPDCPWSCFADFCGCICG